jgi:hypothetical protein
MQDIPRLEEVKFSGENGRDVNASPEVFHSRRQQQRRFPVKAAIDAEPPITPACPLSHDDSVANLHHHAEGGTTTATLTH